MCKTKKKVRLRNLSLSRKRLTRENKEIYFIKAVTIFR